MVSNIGVGDGRKVPVRQDLAGKEARVGSRRGSVAQVNIRLGHKTV